MLIVNIIIYFFLSLIPDTECHHYLESQVSIRVEKLILSQFADNMGVEQDHREQHKMWTIVSYKCSMVCMLDTLLSPTKNGRTNTDQGCYRHQLPVFQHFQ